MEQTIQKQYMCNIKIVLNSKSSYFKRWDQSMLSCSLMSYFRSYQNVFSGFQVKYANQVETTFVPNVSSLTASRKLLPWLPCLCELFDAWGRICMLPSSKARTPGRGPTSPKSTCQHQPANKWLILSFVCRYICIIKLVLMCFLYMLPWPFFWIVKLNWIWWTLSTTLISC